MNKKDMDLLTQTNKQLMKENKELRRTIDNKDNTIERYMDLNVEKNEKIIKLEEGVYYSKSKSAGILSKLGHLNNTEYNIK